MKKKKPIFVLPPKEEITKISEIVVNPKEIFKETIVNIPYDPKTCIKKRLEDFIPKLSLFIPTSDSKHAVDFYMENRSSLIIHESSASIVPSLMKETYSDFSNWIAHLKFKDTLYTKEDLLVNSYENENGEKYVIKKCWNYFDVDNKNMNNVEEFESFIREKFNEYSIMKIVNGSPNSIQPIQFHIIHIPKIKYVVTELLMPFGGSPLTIYLQKLTSKEIYEIVIQVSNVLDYLDSFNIEHNDLKAGNILVDSILGKKIIRLIDLDIGRNISITNKSTQRFGLTGFTSVYCSPEIYQISADPTQHSRAFSCRKSQMYSLGVLILYMCEFFPNAMTANKFDLFKKSEPIYQPFINTLIDYTKSITDPLKRKLMKIAEICLAFVPENRLSAKEIKVILNNLDSKSLETISKQYSDIIHSRITSKTSNGIELNEHEDLIRQMKDEFTFIRQEEEKSIKSLKEENNNFEKTLKIKNEEIEKMKIEEDSLKRLFTKANLEVERLKLLLDESQDSLRKKAHEKAEQENTFKNAKIEIKALLEKNQKLEKENKDLLKNMNEYEVKINENFEKIQNLRKYEKLDQENVLEFNIMKKKFEENKMENFCNCKSYYELVKILYETILNTKEIEIKGYQKTKYIDGMQYSDNAFYNGPLNKENQPHGAGTLIFINPYRKFVGEFENGKCKNNLGIIITENDTYILGKVQNGIVEGICLSFREVSKYLGQSYYFGETKENKANGKGKHFYSDGAYYEGEWKNNKYEGTGKKVNADGECYEGEWKNNKYEGKGKKVYAEGDYYEGEYKNGKIEGKGKMVSIDSENYEGDWKNEVREGMGKVVWSDGGYYEGEWKNDTREGMGKEVYADGRYYEGEWKSDEKHGKGKEIYANGEYFEGEHKKGKVDGKGKYYIVRLGNIEEIQEGLWSNGERKGKFLITNSKNQNSFRNY